MSRDAAVLCVALVSCSLAGLRRMVGISYRAEKRRFQFMAEKDCGCDLSGGLSGVCFELVDPVFHPKSWAAATAHRSLLWYGLLSVAAAGPWLRHRLEHLQIAQIKNGCHPRVAAVLFTSFPIPFYRA